MKYDVNRREITKPEYEGQDNGVIAATEIIPTVYISKSLAYPPGAKTQECGCRVIRRQRTYERDVAWLSCHVTQRQYVVYLCDQCIIERSRQQIESVAPGSETKSTRKRRRTDR